MGSTSTAAWVCTLSWSRALVFPLMLTLQSHGQSSQNESASNPYLTSCPMMKTLTSKHKSKEDCQDQDGLLGPLSVCQAWLAQALEPSVCSKNSLLFTCTSWLLLAAASSHQKHSGSARVGRFAEQTFHTFSLMSCTIFWLTLQMSSVESSKVKLPLPSRSKGSQPHAVDANDTEELQSNKQSELQSNSCDPSPKW